MAKSSSTGKRRPKCQTCHRPTLGHPRIGRKFTCVSESTASSSATPTPKSNSLRLSTPLPSPPASPPATTPSPSPETQREGFQLPSGDTWHWRNPNWVSPPPKWRLHSPSDLERASLTPTEPLTEVPDNAWGSHSIPDAVVEEREPADDASESGDDDENPCDCLPDPSLRDWSPFSNTINFNTALRASTPLFNVFRTPREDLPDVTRTAQQAGKYVGVINAPSTHSGTVKIPREKADGTVWVLVSDREEDLKYAIDSQQRGMPGTLFQEEQRYGIGLLHAVLGGVLGGIVVILGLGYYL